MAACPPKAYVDAILLMHDLDGPECLRDKIANTEVSLNHKSECRELTAAIADDLSVFATVLSLKLDTLIVRFLV